MRCISMRLSTLMPSSATGRLDSCTAASTWWSVTPPMFIETTIVQTDPGFKGDTVQGSTKPATIDTGAVIQVPMYLNEGEVIKVDTRDGKFVSRV